MSGWIKAEKDLCQDIRVLRMATTLRGNASALQGVTLVLGGLIRLWMHADSFARDDDTLDITLDEIDQLTGIEGFGQAIPRDWLEVLDEDRVKLPGFHAHNGTDAKRKALTAKRVSQHRDREKRNGVSNSNALALPDQDQTKTRLDQKKEEARATPALVSREGESLILHESLPEEAWREWLAHRRERRMPMSRTTLQKQLSILSKFDTDTQRQMIDNSIQSGWQGLFAGKANGTHKATPASQWRAPPDEPKQKVG